MAFQQANNVPAKSFGGGRHVRGEGITVLLLLIVTVGSQTIGNGGGARVNSVGQLVQVTPQCGDDMIVVHVRVNPRLRSMFADWIIVGENSRPECRLRGNGELRYVVQIILRNDPCQTKQIEPNVFENTLRIAQFPKIILQDDVNFRFRCSRGIPEVMEFRLPQVNPTFDIDRNVLPGTTRDLLLALSSTPRTALNVGGDQLGGLIFNRPEFGDTNQPSNGLDLNRLAVADASIPAGQSLSNSSGSLYNWLAVLLSAILILSVLVFLLCLLVCLRYYQRRRDADALMKARTGGISAQAVAGGDSSVQSRHLLPAYDLRRQSNGAGQNSSATASPMSRNDSHSPVSSSLSHSGGERNGQHRASHHVDGSHATTWWVGKVGPQSYLVADRGAPSPPGYSIRAVDVPSDNNRQDNVRQQPHKQQQQEQRREQQVEQDPERAAASKAFRDSLHFAHARSTELMRAPNSYAEWRERTLRRGRGSNGADLLLESEDGSSRNNSDGNGNDDAPKRSVTKTPPTIRLPDRRSFIVKDALSPLPPAIHTPLRSITEVYHAAETRPVPQSQSAGNHSKASAVEQSSDEGEYSVSNPSAANPSAGTPRGPVAKKMATPPPAAAVSAEMRDRLIHCADSIRGFGPRKLTEQEIARWRQLIRSDAQLQQLVVEARSVEELKTLCELPDYRLHFTRMKWSQIMECVGEVTLVPVGSISTPKREPPPGYAAAAASQLNLKLNLFKSFGLPMSSSPTIATAASASRDRIHSIREPLGLPQHRTEASQQQDQAPHKRLNIVSAVGGSTVRESPSRTASSSQHVNVDVNASSSAAESKRIRTRW